MKPLLIACDFDDTLMSFIAMWVKSYNRLFPDKTPLTHMDVDRWNLKEVGAITDEELQRTFKDVRENFNYCLDGPAVDANFHYWFKKLQRDGHTIYILTGNPESVKPNIVGWLAKYGIENIEVVCVNSMADKLNKKWDVLIDDSGMLATALKDDPRTFIMYARPHNKAVNNMVKNLAMNWEKVYQLVTQAAQASDTPEEKA